MKAKVMVVIISLLFATTALAHSGRLDKNGGHNCSEKSKKKGLCSGYHYHRVAEVVAIGILDQAKVAARVASKE